MAQIQAQTIHIAEVRHENCALQVGRTREPVDCVTVFVACAGSGRHGTVAERFSRDRTVWETSSRVHAQPESRFDDAR